MIKEAKVFKNGQSQAVRLPKEMRFSGNSVYINKVGEYLIIVPKKDPWQGLIDACAEFSSDFMSDRNQPPLQERNWLE